MMLRLSPSGLETAASCLRKYHFRNHLKLPTNRSPWQELGTKSHQVIERYSLYGEEPEDKFFANILQLIRPFLCAPPYKFTEIECWVNRPASTPLGVDRDTGARKPNAAYELESWVGRTDFQVHLFTDYWPDPDGMDTWDWKQRADTSFRRTPPEDLRDDAQALMYQLFRSWVLFGNWEAAGKHTWHVLDRKLLKHEAVSYTYAQGEALDRWKTVYEPFIDKMQQTFGKQPEKIDPADVPATGFELTDEEGGRECDKWSGCDFARRCMACGTPVFGVFTHLLSADHSRKEAKTFLSKFKGPR
jgi:hypothetical protein